ncbi:MAG: phosphatase PAP2 family protein [Dehalococcoidia bacterium]
MTDASFRMRVRHWPTVHRAALYEIAIATVAFFSYFLVRGFTESAYDRAYDNAERVLSFEQAFNLDQEDAIQDAITDEDWAVDAANWIYIYGHWPVIIVVGTWLMRSRSEEYRVLRNGFLISGAVGLVIFAAFPVAPPRLLDIGLLDTVTNRSEAYRVLQPPALVNQYAAMPSLHFGWDLLIGITLVRYSTLTVVRVIGVLLPIAMAWAVVATANHFIIDCFAGAAVALAGLWLATVIAHHLGQIERKLQGAARTVGVRYRWRS